MKKKISLLIIFLMTAMTLHAFMPAGSSGDQELTQELHSSGIKIIDIRTEDEWKQTGIVQGSYPITFFDEKGHYDLKEFLYELSSAVTKEERFAVICRSGNRTTTVSKLLKKIGFENVINLEGGIKKAARNGVKFEPYK